MRQRIVMLVVLAAAAAPFTSQASAATPAQYGARCNAAWTGKHGTRAHRSYMRHCVAAAVAAVRAARAAGDNDDAGADASRAAAACRTAFPAPRRTAAKRAAYRACVAAAVGAQKAYGGRPLRATLAGDATRDPDGSGAATLTLNQGHGQICFDVTWANLGVVGAVAIRRVADDSVAVALDADSNLADGEAKGCVDGVARDLVKAIRQHPEQYDVTVVTDEFPAGAIRGTLHK